MRNKWLISRFHDERNSIEYTSWEAYINVHYAMSEYWQLHLNHPSRLKLTQSVFTNTRTNIVLNRCKVLCYVQQVLTSAVIIPQLGYFGMFSHHRT